MSEFCSNSVISYIELLIIGYSRELLLLAECSWKKHPQHSYRRISIVATDPY